MNSKEIAIIGYGHVGKNMKKLFSEAIVYDEPKKIGKKSEVNKCGISFICVPTPEGEGGICDTSVVEDVLSWLTTEVIVLRSTVPVGFTDAMRKRWNKRILFQPEYYGETTRHPFAEPQNPGWITLGGRTEDAAVVANVYKKVFNSELRIHYCDAKTAEMAKYMENSFLATKVIFCNQFYDLARKFEINYDILRETWLMDPRIGRSHTFVYEDERGYGGSCLPKDIASIISQAEEKKVNLSLLKEVRSANESMRDKKGEFESVNEI